METDALVILLGDGFSDEVATHMCYEALEYLDQCEPEDVYVLG